MFNNGSNGIPRWWQFWKNVPELDCAPFRRLALQLHNGLPREESVSRSVLIVTPNESQFWAEGCVNLACCMAEELRKPVLLVDAGADSEVSRCLGTEDSQGFAGYLADPTRPLLDLVYPTSQQNLSFLSMGTSQTALVPASPETIKDLLIWAGEHWDFVIIGGGPVLRNSIALGMAPYVGRVLLLPIENLSRLEDIETAQSALEQCRAQNVSVVLSELGNSVW